MLFIQVSFECAIEDFKPISTIPYMHVELFAVIIADRKPTKICKQNRCVFNYNTFETKTPDCPAYVFFFVFGSWYIQAFATRTHACGCRDEAEQLINTLRFICRHMFGSCIVRSLLAFRRILAAVRAQMHIFNINLIASLSHMELTLAVSRFRLTSPSSKNPGLLHRAPPPQRSRRNPECSSKVPLTHA